MSLILAALFLAWPCWLGGCILGSLALPERSMLPSNAPQAKKHYLRRHFNGDKPFACTKCNKKRFVVKEDLTMHMKACGNVFCCR